MRDPAASPKTAAPGLDALGFGVGFLGTWFFTTVVKVPLLWYLPLEHEWVLAKTVTTLGMDFFGRGIAALVVGAITGLAGWWLIKRGPSRWLTIAGVWFLSLVALCCAVELAVLVPRHPVPMERPANFDWLNK